MHYDSDGASVSAVRLDTTDTGGQLVVGVSCGLCGSGMGLKIWALALVTACQF